MSQAPRTDPALWQRLLDWRQGEDASALARTVSVALSITPGSAQLVLDEYIRFACLATISDQPVTPPRLIAETAFQHWRDTAAYSDRFCTAVLGGPLPQQALTPAAPSMPPNSVATRPRASGMARCRSGTCGCATSPSLPLWPCLPPSSSRC